ncbi:type II toxin-antitoxin system VapC family toxin [Thermoleptolyngbya sp. C42_A2020_037]|uniref:type II toxin-antitoxin system VapC family toxin n=1 Tax=Thermoleptolyngbya sp. C42_A2020_037 TaxID=2747799 RepID=UPI0019FA6730|nr:type II toxin-antitoxin system VapC family toxin [Thermoleptolyngbya sp. C42_A2020_037]MBF2085610.1 type II toxin-antitoxin system VapC family toxin [Thermoleptolyngbya sp. C42_A2020_037]
MAARYVVDASVLAHDLNPDRYTAEAANLLSGLVDGHELYIPEFCLLECTNVLWKQVRFNGFPQVDAESIIADFLDLPFQVVAVYLLLPNALKIALSHGLAVYDSLYMPSP